MPTFSPILRSDGFGWFRLVWVGMVWVWFDLVFDLVGLVWVGWGCFGWVGWDCVG